MKITNPYGPNTTVLLPGGCNASCDFCFWDRAEGGIKPPRNYLDKVFSHLASLPEAFRTLSISGGEPTISQWFGSFLGRLGIYRRTNTLDRVVLTTNGSNVAPFITAIGCVVDHINISRHAVGSEANCKIFKTAAIPDDESLREIIANIHSETECDVTLNCVVGADVSVQFCYSFIYYAKMLGADAVSFRKEASDVTPTDAETFFVKKYGVLHETKCPVCRGLEQSVGGFTVRWKGSVAEPSKESNGVYEVVIHPDGGLYSGWDLLSTPLEILRIYSPVRSTKKLSSGTGYSAGCGRGGRTGC